jgi:hypothetical protein
MPFPATYNYKSANKAIKCTATEMLGSNHRGHLHNRKALHMPGQRELMANRRRAVENAGPKSFKAHQSDGPKVCGTTPDSPAAQCGSARRISAETHCTPESALPADKRLVTLAMDRLIMELASQLTEGTSNRKPDTGEIRALDNLREIAILMFSSQSGWNI